MPPLDNSPFYKVPFSKVALLPGSHLITLLPSNTADLSWNVMEATLWLANFLASKSPSLGPRWGIYTLRDLFWILNRMESQRCGISGHLEKIMSTTLTPRQGHPAVLKSGSGQRILMLQRSPKRATPLVHSFLYSPNTLILLISQAWHPTHKPFLFLASHI